MADKIKNQYNVERDFIENLKVVVSMNKGFFSIAFILLLGIGIWQQNAISSFLGLDRHFEKNEQDFKIIILPFKQLCEDKGKNYDAGFVIKERLNGIIHKDTLKIQVFYWENFDFQGFDDQKADELRKYHYADMIIYGVYQTESCSAEGKQICLNYITDQKWKLGNTGMNIDKEIYQKGGVDELKKGTIQARIEAIAFYVSVLAQVKNIDQQRYLGKLKELLAYNRENEKSGSMRATIYYDIAEMLLEDGKHDEAMAHFRKALIDFKKTKSLKQYIHTLGNIAECHLKKQNRDSANIYYQKGISYVQTRIINRHIDKFTQSEKMTLLYGFHSKGLYYSLVPELLFLSKGKKYDKISLRSAIYFFECDKVTYSFLCDKLKEERHCKEVKEIQKQIKKIEEELLEYEL